MLRCGALWNGFATVTACRLIAWNSPSYCRADLRGHRRSLVRDRPGCWRVDYPRQPDESQRYYRVPLSHRVVDLWCGISINRYDYCSPLTNMAMPSLIKGMEGKRLYRPRLPLCFQRLGARPDELCTGRHRDVSGTYHQGQVGAAYRRGDALDKRTSAHE